MKYRVVRRCGPGGARLGELVTAHGDALPTPRLALLTRAGAVPHVTRAVLERALPEAQLLLAPLAGLAHLEAGLRAHGGGLAQFVGSRPQDAWIMTLDDASVEIADGHFQGDTMPLWMRHGKVLIDPKRYMELASLVKPDACCVLADTRAPRHASRKRVMRAAARTVRWLQDCLQLQGPSTPPLLGVVTAWQSAEAASQIARAVKGAAGVAGVFLAGLAAPSEAATLQPDTLAHTMQAAIPGMEADMWDSGLHVVTGSWSPGAAACLVECGADVLDSGLAGCLADCGAALVFPLTPRHPQHEDLVIQLHHNKHKTEFRPLVHGCECVTCRTHTRAYIHHLCRTQELLAPLLLTLHNLHHYSGMLAEMRSALAAGSFPQLRAHLVALHPRWLLQLAACTPAPATSVAAEPAPVPAAAAEPAPVPAAAAEPMAEARKRARADAEVRESTPPRTHAI